MVKRSQLDPDTVTHLDIAVSSRTFGEYVFKCEIANIRPRCEYEYDVGHYNNVLMPNGKPGECLLQAVEP